MSSPYLSKSDFKVARTCATKLYYRKQRYPSTKSEDPYLEFLADGGFMVGKMAQIIHPGGVDLEALKGNPEELARKTAEYLKQDSVTLFEPAVLSGLLLARIDVLIKRGSTLELIEVKSKSYDSDEEVNHQNKGKRTTLISSKGIDSDWREYLEDVTFQTICLERSYPALVVKPYLMLADKAKTTNIDRLFSQFELLTHSAPGAPYREVEVRFHGDEDALRADHFLTKVDVGEEVSLLREEVTAAIAEFEASLTPKLTKIHTVPGKRCKKCEYRPEGFNECLGPLAEVTPSVFDLYYAGSLKQGGTYVLDDLLAIKKASLFDIPDEAFTKTRGERQRIQLEYTKKNQEWQHPQLKREIARAKYPLHFIDFETSRIAVPYHAGMRPYQQVAFQFSCHTFSSPGEAPVHKEWINIEESFPNFQFAEALRDAIGDSGSVLVWSHHEQSVVKDIVKLFGQVEAEDQALVEWLINLTDENAEGAKLIDLRKLCEQYYFHPKMKGSTSLKYVFPAIWESRPELHDVSYFRKYFQEQDGEVLNPYDVLDEIEIAGSSEAIREGTGAMRAYQEMMYGVSSKDEEKREKWKQLLLQYCELDTLAMVVVWEGWGRSENLDLQEIGES